jgi:hypothetical protein
MVFMFFELRWCFKFGFCGLFFVLLMWGVGVVICG